jgi:hypothetical protein
LAKVLWQYTWSIDTLPSARNNTPQLNKRK